MRTLLEWYGTSLQVPEPLSKPSSRMRTIAVGAGDQYVLFATTQS